MENENNQQYRPTAEELAWDEEFKSDSTSRSTGGFATDLTSMAMFAARLPGALLSATLPEETVRHTRAAARESFLAVRSFLGAIGDRIEEMLTEPEGAHAEPAVQGPPGTWGSGRTANPEPVATTALRPLSSPKVKRIDVNDTPPEPTSAPGDMP